MNSQNSSEPTQLDPKAEYEPATCVQHGAYQSRVMRVFNGHEIRTGCQKCRDEVVAKQETARLAQEERAKREKIEALFRRSAIPTRFADRTLENYRAENAGQKRALQIATRYAESFSTPGTKGPSLVMCGRPGTGKTHLACAVGHALCEQGRSVLFGSVLSAVRHIKETYRKDSLRTESDAIDDLVLPELLILDEVGVQVGSEHEKMLVFEIINERYQECRATVLISNLDQDELTAYLGERVMDRFRESGAVLAFDWASYRGSKTT